MNIAMLSTDQAPPISVPLRFFAVAPLFLLLAAWLIAQSMTDGINPLDNMHSPAMLAATHCITLGFMALVMMGAIQQILPVVVGSPMPASRLVAWFTLLPLVTGTLSLCGGFMLSQPGLLHLAWGLLSLAFVIFISASLTSLALAAAKNATKNAILMAVLALAGTITLGAWMAHGYADGVPLDYRQLATAHISLGLGGWVMLLIIGVSYQVVPMFQLTPNYPARLANTLPPALLAALLSSLVARQFQLMTISELAEGAFWLLAIGFAAITLRLQSHRKRRVADATLSFFRLGMVSLLCAAMLSMLAMIPTIHAYFRSLSIILFICGFAISVIHGMLYKIVPFLVWFHLFRGGITQNVPNMKEIIPEVWIWRHYWLHIATLLAIVLTTMLMEAIWLVIIGLILQGLLLSFAMYTGIAVYSRTLARIEKVEP